MAYNNHLHNLDQTLVQVAKLLNSKKIPWLLGASGALYVHGLAITPQDLDFFTSAQNVQDLEKDFQPYLTNPLHYFDQVNQKEIEFQAKINDIDIEVCELDISSGELVKIDFHGVPIPVSPLAEYLKIYSDNPKHADRVALIRDSLKKDSETHT